ncbi:aldose epimerase family protein [Paratractidigestivibacter sp.]|uniref:aldose epimerase family protein n=1 Tax=Paratractidigestivibacter sp. TaxID=2847316 RepID=UPI002AC9BE2E|nr:aldose epimerase family protein [Paratractidigestivibacter sp.]
MQVNGTAFGQLPDGGDALLFTISNKAGMQVALTNVGGCIVSVKVPTAAGELVDCVLGYDDAAGYVNNGPMFGAPVGRVVNRIAGASFELGGTTYELTANEGPNANHSGRDPWFQREWEVVRAEQGEDGGTVEFRLLSPDGDQGFPGEVDMHMTYELDGHGALCVTYDGTASAPTLINMTNHSYFNLNGCDGQTVLHHRLTVDADSYTETTDALIPTGRVLPIDGTPLDVHDGKELEDVVGSKAPSIVNARGIDHNLVLAPTEEGRDGFVGAQRHVARLEADQTGIVLDISTDLPGMQVYTGNYVEGSSGKGGVAYHDHCAVALETNFYADAIHHPNFPQPVFGPDRPYRTRTVYAFSAR